MVRPNLFVTSPHSQIGSWKTPIRLIPTNCFSIAIPVNTVLPSVSLTISLPIRMHETGGAIGVVGVLLVLQAL